MNELGKIYLEFEIKAIDELELISRVKQWYNFNNVDDFDLSNKLQKIIRLNTKTDNRFIAPNLLKEIVKLYVDDYENQKEYFALLALRAKCTDLVKNKIGPSIVIQNL